MNPDLSVVVCLKVICVFTLAETTNKSVNVSIVQKGNEIGLDCTIASSNSVPRRVLSTYITFILHLKVFQYCVFSIIYFFIVSNKFWILLLSIFHSSFLLEICTHHLCTTWFANNSHYSISITFIEPIINVNLI